MVKGSGTVVVIGDIMVDIAIKPAAELRVGSDTASEIRLGVGGTGTNTAIHLTRLGVDALLLGRVGNDDLGRFVRERLHDEGVRLPGAPRAGASTGAIGIFIDKTGQRTMFPQQGANTLVNVDFIRNHWPGTSDDGVSTLAALFVSGYALFRATSREAALWAMAQARNAGVPVFVDPASYALIEDVGAQEFLSWTAGATVLLPNREEAAVLSRMEVDARAGAPPDTSISAAGGEAAAKTTRVGGRMTLEQARDAARHLAQQFPVVVVTLDGEGALARSGGGEWYAPGHNVPVVDTTGAGDSFNAAFVAEYIAGNNVRTAMEAGIRLAASVVQRMGPT